MIPGQENPEPEVQINEQISELKSQLAGIERQIEHLLHHQSHLHKELERLQRKAEQERRAPRSDFGGAFGWDARVLQLLRDSFGLSTFRPLQREVVNATLHGRDAIALMAAGGGKSVGASRGAWVPHCGVLTHSYVVLCSQMLPSPFHFLMLVLTHKHTHAPPPPSCA